MWLSILIAHVDANTFWLLYKTSTTLLQMSDDNPYVIPEMDPTLRKQIQQCNWQVVNVTTPANYFHVLRRQVIFFLQIHSFLLWNILWCRCTEIFSSCFLDTPGLQEAFDCDVPKEPPSPQGLQVESIWVWWSCGPPWIWQARDTLQAAHKGPEQSQGPWGGNQPSSSLLWKGRLSSLEAVFSRKLHSSPASKQASLWPFFFCYGFRCTMNWMKKEGRQSALMLPYVELSSSARSHTTSSSGSWRDIQVCLIVYKNKLLVFIL